MTVYTKILTPSRADRLPSYWSECGFLKLRNRKFTNSSLFCLPLLQPETGSYAPKRNGLVEYPINTLMCSQKFPNLALLAIPVAEKSIVDKLKTYQESLIAYNAVENIIPWLAYIWGVGNTNPLIQQIGFPSAMLLNHLYSANNFDLSPSINNQLSTPEVFWNGVKNWSEFYIATKDKESLPKGLYVIDHQYDIEDY